MIGDKLLQVPDKFASAGGILDLFNMPGHGLGHLSVDIAKRLVEMNNEVYERLHPDGEDLLKQRMTPEIEDKVDKLIERLDRLIEVKTNK